MKLEKIQKQLQELGDLIINEPDLVPEAAQQIWCNGSVTIHPNTTSDYAFNISLVKEHDWLKEFAKDLEEQ